MKRWFVPEVVQTSALDCGPAALKSLLGGFGIDVNYGRLREACQTGLDGTSIDTLETVAGLLGLAAEQMMVPADHVLTPRSSLLPAIAVVTTPGGLTHFVVVWRKHGTWLQVMDPAIGRRWVRQRHFQRELYQHTVQVAAADWREFASSDQFQRAVRGCLQRCGISGTTAAEALGAAASDRGWKSFAALDAAARALAALRSAGGIPSSRAAERAFRSMLRQVDSIPARFWSVQAADESEDAELLVRGAVLIKVSGRKSATVAGPLPGELSTVVAEKTPDMGAQLWAMLGRANRAPALLLALTVPLAVSGLLIEALLFRGLFDVAAQLHLAGQRMAAMAALVLFSVLLLVLELMTFRGATRFSRHLESCLRMAFLAKIPKLGDQYFQSRLISDMGERCHALHRVRNLPDLLRSLLAAVSELLLTAAAMIWLEPATAPFVVFAVASALIPAVLSRSLLAEGDMRVRSHAAGLTRFYLDAALGFSSIRSHGAEENLRRAHGTLLSEWIRAAMRLQHTVVSLEALQTVTMFGAIAAMFLAHPLQGSNVGSLLLVAYWALNLPTLGQAVGVLARQYPGYRSLAMRVCEPLGTPEEKTPSNDTTTFDAGPAISFLNVSAEAGGHPVLQRIDLDIAAGSHVAIVGRSGAGKSSLLGMLLGWLTPSQGAILVGGEALDIGKVRRSSAWVDPAVQLWNRSLYGNLAYGSDASPADVGEAVEYAHLRPVLQQLPDGLQTELGESGKRLSGGEGQRVRFGRALLKTGATLVLLDEPFRGLDREVRSRMLLEARERWSEATLLCVTHDLTETRQFDRVLVMEGGRIVEDGEPELLSQASSSRYRQLLDAEKSARAWLWNARPWRRLRVEAGKLSDECVTVSESEVA